MTNPWPTIWPSTPIYGFWHHGHERLGEFCCEYDANNGHWATVDPMCPMDHDTVIGAPKKNVEAGR